MNNTRTIKILSGALLIVLVIAIYLLDQYGYFDMKTFQEHRTLCEEAVHGHPVLAAIGFIALYVAVTISGVPVSLFMTVTGGFLFGVTLGSIYSLIACIIGSCASFILFRLFFHSSVQSSHGSLVTRFNHKVEQSGGYYLLVLHLLSVIPISLITMLASVSPLSLRQFFGYTAAGVIPGIVFFCYLGKQLSTLSHHEQLSMNDYLPFIISVGILLIVLTVVYRFKERLLNR